MALDENILKKTLQELDGEDWGKPLFQSHLVTECHRLRQVPLERFDVENLRIMIGQNIGLEYLISLALDRLLLTPWVSGDFYEGDLLKNVLSVPVSFWHSHPEYKHVVDHIVEKALLEVKEATPTDAEFYDEVVLQQIQMWKGSPGQKPMQDT